MSLDVYLTNNQCTHCGRHDEVFNSNITHNLGTMAKEAGIYEILWHPEEINVTKAGQLITPLQTALADMKTRPEYYSKFNSNNGWGTYKDFIQWLTEYLTACEKYPEATITVSR